MAVCDANYRFTYLDVGAYGSEGDVNIFRNSGFGQQVVNDQQDFPEDANINGEKLPFYYIGDDAFPLCKRMMKPYGGRNLTDEQRIFNYRLSRARRCIENAFGILSSKWLVLKKSMFCSPDRAQKIITACCLLHNYLLNDNRRCYCPSSFADKLDSDRNVVEGEWRSRIDDDSLYFGNIPASLGRSNEYAKLVRDKLKDYVNSPQGSVPWQNRLAFVP